MSLNPQTETEPAFKSSLVQSVSNDEKSSISARIDRQVYLSYQNISQRLEAVNKKIIAILKYH